MIIIIIGGSGYPLGIMQKIEIRFIEIIVRVFVNGPGD